MMVMGNTEILPITCIVLIHLTLRSMPIGATRTSPLHDCLVWSKVVAEGGAMLLYMSIPRNPK